jgi:hypothetical protein
VTDRRGTLWAAILGSGIVFLDSSVLTVALPRIAGDLPAHVVGILEGESYVYNGYLLGESAFLILVASRRTRSTIVVVVVMPWCTGSRAVLIPALVRAPTRRFPRSGAGFELERRA